MLVGYQPCWLGTRSLSRITHLAHTKSAHACVCVCVCVCVSRCTGEMTGIPDLCFPDVASDWLPKTAFKCKADKDTDDDQGDDSDLLTKAAKKSDKCKDLAEKDCKGDCTW